MRILFDHNTPRGIARHLVGRKRHHRQRARTGFDILLTADKNLRYQQNLSGRKIALVVLGNSRWGLVRLHLNRIAAVVNAAKPGSDPQNHTK